ncbi:6,7-dimethyl-8-ribityllumazine synthase [Verrucomicrobium sp. GAS474]|uniref:6,7-dimethyl-8-ribityllumazine synthase n=1 Tax=Verrucomicrobium sp. GAS474 TaxID=1882831 RepID=UPI00087C85A2|nr:6,7-dimethyl-8-ribityllumazine synthase [Verrucomicrobium sp. GAS474]SDU16309.1 6,7-dimethyl-8-ribityllumazine synthase [Verrucomicrobium sp. GAS474]
MGESSSPAGPYRYAAVVSTYHQEYCDAMLVSAQRELREHEIDVVRVPGAFEIPIAVQRLARTGAYDGILAFGVVWTGKTFHATEILRACTDALMRIVLDYNIPVFHEILSVDNEKDVRARTSGRLNRGLEAARAAIALSTSLSEAGLHVPRRSRTQAED